MTPRCILAAAIALPIAVAIAACGFEGVGASPASAEGGGGGGDGGGGGADGEALDGAEGGGHDPNVGPPACDPANEASCLALPAGWSLVAADLGPGGAARPPVPCPAGFDAPADVVEGPAAAADACVCSACTVTAQASCAGGSIAVNYSTTSGNCESSAQALSNNPAGQCLQLTQTGSATGTKSKLTPTPPTGGACAAGPAVAYADRVTYAGRARTCREATRCSGGTCDARVDAPFRACLANDGDVPCPAGFPNRHVTGTVAAFDCGACAGCTVAATCKATTDLYLDTACATGKVTVATDGTCQTPPYNGTYRSYRYTGTATTTCAASGAAVAAANVRVTAPRTLCCAM